MRTIIAALIIANAAVALAGTHPLEIPAVTTNSIALRYTRAQLNRAYNVHEGIAVQIKAAMKIQDGWTTGPKTK